MFPTAGDATRNIARPGISSAPTAGTSQPPNLDLQKENHRGRRGHGGKQKKQRAKSLRAIPPAWSRPLGLHYQARKSSARPSEREGARAALRFIRVNPRRKFAGYWLLTSDYWLPSFAVEAPNKLHQAADGDSRRAFGDPGFVFFHPGDAGDIEVDPGRLVNKFFQEHGSGDGPAPAPATVDDVGDARADHLFVFLIHRQAPHFFAGALQRLGEALIHF